MKILWFWKKPKNDALAAKLGVDTAGRTDRLSNLSSRPSESLYDVGTARERKSGRDALSRRRRGFFRRGYKFRLGEEAFPQRAVVGFRDLFDLRLRIENKFGVDFR